MIDFFSLLAEGLSCESASTLTSERAVNEICMYDGAASKPIGFTDHFYLCMSLSSFSYLIFVKKKNVDLKGSSMCYK